MTVGGRVTCIQQNFGAVMRACGHGSKTCTHHTMPLGVMVDVVVTHTSLL